MISYFKKVIKLFLRVNNISYFKNISNDKLLSLIKLFHPHDLGYDLIRIGDNSDGGYLVPNCLDGIKNCFSIGVDNKTSFENDLFKKGINSFLADYSQDVLKIPNKFNFEKKNIKSFNSEKSLNINEWIENKRRIISNENLIFQIDAEGFEYEIISSILDSNLDQIKILIIEFHDLDYSGNRTLYQIIDSAMSKILKKFDVCHIHANNWKDTVLVNKYEFPSNLEVTFLNKKFSKYKKKIKNLPHLLDFKNVINKPDVNLKTYWYL
tara:strand:- start:454 stop:1251 length:798 start_codon:yes stop_codon:yes gene_type:complete